MKDNKDIKSIQDKIFEGVNKVYKGKGYHRDLQKSI